jgi:hypothetical protein
MPARGEAHRPSLTTAAGTAGVVGGIGLVGAGIRARRDVRRSLARERIAWPERANSNVPVADARRARSLAELIRRNTLAATGGRTYAETDPYLDETGAPTSDAALSARHGRTAHPVENRTTTSGSSRRRSRPD